MFSDINAAANVETGNSPTKQLDKIVGMRERTVLKVDSNGNTFRSF